MRHQPKQWEKVIASITGLSIVILVMFLAIRNQPVADPNVVVMLRTLLSLVAATFGAVVPGIRQVGFSMKGIAIRATGALALFVLTFVLTPTVIRLPS